MRSSALTPRPRKSIQTSAAFAPPRNALSCLVKPRGRSSGWQRGNNYSGRQVSARRRAAQCFPENGSQRDPLDTIHQRIVSVFLPFAIIADPFAVRLVSGDIQVLATDR